MLGRLFESQAQREQRETAELYDLVQTQFLRSPLAGQDTDSHIAMVIVNRVHANHPVSKQIMRAMYVVTLAFIEADELCSFPRFNRSRLLGLQEGHELRKQLRRIERFLADEKALDQWCWGIDFICQHFAERLTAHLRAPDDGAEKDRTLAFNVDALDVMEDPIGWIEVAFQALIIAEICDLDMYRTVRAVAQRNIERASGRDSPNSVKPYLTPAQYAAKHPSATPREIADLYLIGTPVFDLTRIQIPFLLPRDARFTHTHVLGGSGHGKTQALQRFELADLERVKEGQASLVVIDSQGDMLDTITHLVEFDPDHPKSLADRLVLIDPNDIEHPPCLNLFDVGLDRLDSL